MARVTIDGRAFDVPDHFTILEAARSVGIHIPHLCYHRKLTPFGGCRLCIVEVAGIARPVTSCNTAVSEGMVVSTSTEEIERLRKMLLELILSDHPNDCMLCESAGDCKLQDLAYVYGIRENRYAGERRVYSKRDGNPFIERDLEKCILCGRCVIVCNEVQGVEAIDFAYRGFASKVCTNFEDDLDCEFCGQCISVCPTGALTGKLWAQKGRQRGAKEVKTVCPYCGTGCNLTVQVKHNEILKITSDKKTWNEGWLCVKGRFGYRFVSSPERLAKPLIRVANKSEEEEHIHKNIAELFREATWDEALDLIATKLLDIKKRYGPDALGGLSSARCTNEENYLFQKMIRAAIGTNNVDHCARL